MGGTDTQAKNPSHRLHQTKATIRSCHVNCFLSVRCLHSEVIQQAVEYCCVNICHMYRRDI